MTKLSRGWYEYVYARSSQDRNNNILSNIILNVFRSIYKYHYVVTNTWGATSDDKLRTMTTKISVIYPNDFLMGRFADWSRMLVVVSSYQGQYHGTRPHMTDVAITSHMSQICDSYKNYWFQFQLKSVLWSNSYEYWNIYIAWIHCELMI